MPDKPGDGTYTVRNLETGKTGVIEVKDNDVKVIGTSDDNPN